MISRRDFLAGVAAGVAGNAAYAGLLTGVRPSTWERLIDFIFTETPKFEYRYPDHLMAAKSLFGEQGDIVKLVGGRAHYQYPDAMHPDDQWACDTIIQYAAQLAEKHQFESNVPDPSPYGSFVCTGSPVSNGWTRAFLEYRYVDQDRPELGLQRTENPRLKLPFEFELRHETIRRAAREPLHRTETNRSVLNWSVRTRSGHILVPNTKDRESDFLLITRLPNWKESGALKNFTNTVTVFGGTHGVGTSAVRLVLSDFNLLKRILLKTQRYEYWQVLLTVNAMESGAHPYSKNKRLIAKSINENFECELVTLS
jgi:hypothetical protein